MIGTRKGVESAAAILVVGELADDVLDAVDDHGVGVVVGGEFGEQVRLAIERGRKRSSPYDEQVAEGLLVDRAYQAT